MDTFFEKNKIKENKPEYGSKEYIRNAVKKHYREKGGKMKSRERYYNTKYGKEIVSEYKSKYGEDFITMLKIDKLKLSLSDSSRESSEGSNEDNLF
jgi:hypothetical protein